MSYVKLILLLVLSLLADFSHAWKLQSIARPTLPIRSNLFYHNVKHFELSMIQRTYKQDFLQIVEPRTAPSDPKPSSLSQNSKLFKTKTFDWMNIWKKYGLNLLLFMTLFFGMNTNSISNQASAADTIAIGKCLLTSCQKELAECILNPKCLANVICLNTCNNAKDEATCQIRCGDLFENDVVGRFNTCAVSSKRCVPQKQNDGSWPLPATQSMVKSFDTAIWNGRWYISAGLNPIFDIFDCQVHFFTSPSPGKFYAKIFWRITEPDGEFFTKDAIQRFYQDPKNPAHLINHDNEYLHYKDDWYIIDYEPDDFVLVYYRGSNDAWDGYGGAFLYTKSPSVRPDLIPRLEKAVSSMNLKYKWKDFIQTDNSCPPQPENPTVLREKFAKRLLITEEKQLQEQLTVVRNSAINTLVKEEKEAAKSIQYLENELLKFQSELLGRPEKK